MDTPDILAFRNTIEDIDPIWDFEKGVDPVLDLKATWVNGEDEKLENLKMYGRYSMDTKYHLESSYEMANFEEYYIFSLTSRYQSLLDIYMKDLVIEVAKSYINNAIVFVPIYQGNNIKPDTTMVSMLRHAEEYMSDYCVILHLGYSLEYRGKCFPKEWLRSVLPFLKKKMLKDGTLLEQEDMQVKDGKVYANLGASCSSTHYTERYALLKHALLKLIESLYDTGVIYLDPNEDKDFISNWQMFRSEVEGLYKPNWSNYWITSSPTDFLTDRLLGHESISFKLSRGDRSKHAISSALSGNHAYVFIGDYVIVDVNTYKDAANVQQMIVESLQKTDGLIKIDTFSSLTEEFIDSVEYTDYLDISKGAVRSFKVVTKL